MILDNNLDFDIVIEDASHFLKDQIISLFMIFKKVRSIGVWSLLSFLLHAIMKINI